jgi:hypothetical protein
MRCIKDADSSDVCHSTRYLAMDSIEIEIRNDLDESLSQAPSA